MPRILGDRELELWELNILDLVQDGKSVKKGDFVVQLDANKIMASMRQEMQNLEKEVADLNNAKIDSTVTLSNLREEIKNARLDLEYNKIDLEQSKFESEAYQRKTQMAYQKAENNIEKKERDYLLERNKLKVRVGRTAEWVERRQKKIAKFQEAMGSTRITAPEDGIVIFGKSWEGKKFSKDDGVPTYEFAPAIASLPDMSKVLSEIYVKEIDIAKINTGDSVRVTFDALENVMIMGSIKTIARIGESHKDFDMKAFKVVIHLDNTNEYLKPAMNSNNDIILAQSDNVISVPLISVFKENGAKYVYLKENDSIRKQEIKTDIENETSVLVEEGLKEGDLVVLEPPLEQVEVAEK
jgi:multidrug efflux pump subunit AcrA (membrane-fusion protein)